MLMLQSPGVSVCCYLLALPLAVLGITRAADVLHVELPANGLNRCSGKGPLKHNSNALQQLVGTAQLNMEIKKAHLVVPPL
jgi:hypothetical protein